MLHAISHALFRFRLGRPFYGPAASSVTGEPPRMKLTTRFIEGLKGDLSNNRELSDDDSRGLYLRVSTTGVKSWMFRYTRADGSRAKLGLGRFPALGLADARERAMKAQVQVADGGDPAGERKSARRAARRRKIERPRKLTDLWAIYERDVMPTKRATTNKFQLWLWKARLKPRLGDYDLTEIDRSLVRTALKEIGIDGPTIANRTLALLRHMLNVAVDEELLTASPISRMAKPFKEISRDRVLKEQEIKLLWRALDAAPRSPELHISRRLCAGLKLALVTGARGIEIVGIHADEIDVANRLWTIPAERFKGKRPHTVPLSSLGFELLETAFGCAAEKWTGFAFPNAVHDDRPAERMSLTRAMQEVVRDAKMLRVTPHDLRRTMATYMASERIGVPPHVVTAVLGHVADGAAVTRIYNRHAYDKEKRTALDAWANLLRGIVTSEEPITVPEMVSHQAA